MADEPNFLDLAALSKITPDLVVEKFGGRINSSFFDGSNILGTLRLKGLIDFTANFPGQSVITITDPGKQLLKEATDKSTLMFDGIDLSILQQLQAGRRSYVDIGNAVNLRPSDLAMHLYKLSQQQYTVYEIKNGALDIMLTEKGLTQATTGMPPQQPQAAPQQVQQPAMQQGQMAAPAPPMPGQMPQAPAMQEGMPQGQSFEDIEKQIKMSKRGLGPGKLKAIAVVVVLIIAIIIVLYGKGIIKF